MNRSYSKLRHIQELNRVVESNFLEQKTIHEQWDWLKKKRTKQAMSQIAPTGDDTTPEEANIGSTELSGAPKVGQTYTIWSNQESARSNSNANKLGSVRLDAIRQNFKSDENQVEFDVTTLEGFKFAMKSEIAYGLSKLSSNPKKNDEDPYNSSLTDKYNKLTFSFACKRKTKLILSIDSKIRTPYTGYFSPQLTDYYFKNFCEVSNPGRKNIFGKDQKDKYAPKIGEIQAESNIWTILSDNKPYGPYTTSQIISMLNQVKDENTGERVISRGTQINKQGEPNYVAIETFPEFKATVDRLNPYRPEEKIWYLAINGQQAGPFSTNDIINKINNPQSDLLPKISITRETPIWKEGMKDWAKIETISPFVSTFKALPPSIPPIPTENK